MTTVISNKYHVIVHKSAPRCSDYDDECVDVLNPISCWCGEDKVIRNGQVYTTPPSDGYCPLMFNK